MEKYSKWRDAGTGVQPFLPPVAVSTSSLQLVAYKGLAYAFAVVRMASLVLIGVAYTVVVGLPSKVLGWDSAAIPLLLNWPSTVLLRLALLFMGYFNITSEVVSTKRGRSKNSPKISPRKGDLIVANWTSYIEIVYLTFRFNPTFALPIHTPPAVDPSRSASVTGRQTGTGSSNIDLPSISSVPSSPLLGYLPVSLFTMLNLTGHTPAHFYSSQYEGKGVKLYTLEELCDQAPGPVVLFPEGTTTNSRGLLRSSEGLFGAQGWEVPVRKRAVWVCWFKHPPPTAYSPSASLAIPSATEGLNPLPHLFHSILCQLSPREMVARWLHPDCSPSSGDFLPSEILGLNSGSSSMQTKSVSRSASSSAQTDVLAQCLTLIMLQLGRAKQIGMGWEDKEAFLDFWKEKNRRSVRVSKTIVSSKGKKRR